MAEHRSPLLPGPSPSTSRPPRHQDDPHLAPEEDDYGSPNLATEERVGCPIERNSSLFRSPEAAGPSTGFQTPRTTISAGLDEDAEADDVDGESDDNRQNVIDLEDPLDNEELVRLVKSLRSNSWKEFVPIVAGGQIVKGKCKHCDTLIGAKRGGGTSALGTHLRRCKKRSRALRIVQDLSSTLRSPGGARLKNWSYDPQASRQAFLRMISLHEMPFVVAEYDGFRKFLETLNPMFNLGCRVSARNGCMRDFQQKNCVIPMFKVLAF